MSQGVATYSSTFKASFLKRFDVDGSVWIEAIAHDDLTAKTPYKIIVNEFGQVTAAIADDVTNYYVGVPAAAISSGDKGWFQIGGICEDVVTPELSVAVGHAFSILNGAITDVGGDYSGLDGQFAVCSTASTDSTTQDMVLIPERIKGTT